jgi:hypothetical protein
MMPIVNGLEAEFGNEVAFLYLNAADHAEGQQAFEVLDLPGHPSYVIFTPAGEERYRAFGIVSEDSLQLAIENTLESPMSTDAP